MFQKEVILTVWRS